MFALVAAAVTLFCCVALGLLQGKKQCKKASHENDRWPKDFSYFEGVHACTCVM